MNSPTTNLGAFQLQVEELHQHLRRIPTVNLTWYENNRSAEKCTGTVRNSRHVHITTSSKDIKTLSFQ